MTAAGTEYGADHAMATPVERVQDLLGMLRRRWRVVLGVLALTVGTTLTVGMHGAPQYDATAQILLQPPDTVSQTIMPGLIPSSADAQRDIDTNAALITAPPVVRAVRRELHLRVNDRTVADNVTVTGQNNSNLVSITARDSSPKLARRIATAFAEQYAAYRLRIVQAAVNGALKAGRARLRALKRFGVTGATVGALRARVAELEASAAVQTGGVQVLRRARQPTSSATPQRLHSAIIAVIVGTLAALAAAFVLQLTDTRLRTGADAEAAFAVPVLAVMPASRRADRRRSDDQRELYAELAARLGYVGNGGPGVLTVSSSGRGRSSVDVVSQLAAQLAALHRAVIVVEAELGVTTAETNAPEARVAGLWAVLEGRSSLAQELTQVHIVADAVGPGRPTAADAISYQVLPAGGPVSNPGALLGRSTIGGVLSDARLRANPVIVQAAAPERVSESLPVAALSDGIVLIAELHRTTREDAAAARRALEGIYGRVLGVIVMPRGPRRNMRAVRWSGGTAAAGGAVAAGSAAASGASAMLTGGGAVRGAIASKALIALALIGVAGGGYAAVQHLSSDRSPALPAHATPARTDQNRGVKPPVDGGVPSTSDDQCTKQPATVHGACQDRAPAVRDGDGIPKRKDRCPSTPASTPDGCPRHAPTHLTPSDLLLATRADRDGDGIPKRRDRCPSMPASTPDGCPRHGPTDATPTGQLFATQQLPDRDGDGIPKRQDRCPSSPASTPNGCPHAAPTDPTPTSQPLAGQSPAGQSPAGQSPAGQSPAAQSPAAQPPAAQPVRDRDGDGIPNRQDSCPIKPASTPNGCPDPAPIVPPPTSQPPLADRDGDGIPNRQDSCPNKPASTPSGCPDIPPPDRVPPRP